MSFSFYRREGGKFMSTGVTTQFKPLCAVFQLPVPAVKISPHSMCVGSWAAEPAST